MKTKFLLAMVAVLFLSFQNCSQVAFEQMASQSSNTGQTIPEVPICTELTAAAVQPKLKWDWVTQLDLTKAENYPDYLQVMATPVVGDLNGDGRPEVVFVSWNHRLSGPPAAYAQNGVLRIVDGATGQTIRSVGDSDLAPFASTTPLLIDIDRDGRTEIFYAKATSGEVVALNYDGSLRWKHTVAGANLENYLGFSAADLDNDGTAEIIVGRWAISEDSNRQPIQKWQAEIDVATGRSFAIHLDPQNPNLKRMVASNGVFDLQGKTVFTLPAAFYSAANIDNTPALELVGTGGGKLRIVDGVTGVMKLDLDLSIYNELKCLDWKGNPVIGGGPPTLGDFDGDETTVEIAVATGRYLTVFDGSGNIIAKYPTQDCSSLATGLSSFDFNGDGKPEILYSDEEYLRIFELVGNELRVVWKTVNPSGTLYEYPVVADIDGNQSSELLVVSNNYAVNGFYSGADEVGDRDIAKGITGLRAFESTQQFAWMPTRSLWNSFDYNPAFVTDNLQAAANTSTTSFTSRLFRRNAQLGMFEQRCQ